MWSWYLLILADVGCWENKFFWRLAVPSVSSFQKNLIFNNIYNNKIMKYLIKFDFNNIVILTFEITII
jgi:hypothetical protein